MRAIAACFVLFWSVNWAISDSSSTLWGNLKQGHHKVGFQSAVHMDPSRPFKRKHDYQGNLQSGDRSRPIQLSVWYPAAPAGTAMTFEDYVQLTAKELAAGEPTAAEKEQATQNFLRSRWAQGAPEDKLRGALNMKMLASRNSPPVKERFPLVLLTHSTGLSYAYGNAVLAEYLASHGYVVATVPTVGLQSRNTDFDSISVLTLMQDMQWTIAQARQLPFVDPDKLAVIGFSFGAMPAALLAMQNTDVDAMVSLDGVMGNRFGYSVLFQNPLYEPAKLLAPVLHLTTAETTPDTDWKFFQSLTYSNVHTLKFKGLSATDFSTFGMIAPIVPKFAGSNQTTSEGHEVACLYVLNFLDAHVKKDPKAEAFLKNKPEQNGLRADFMTSELRPGLPVPPSEPEFIKIVREKGIGEARSIFQQVQKNDPDYDLFSPDALIAISQEFIRDKKAKEAIEVQKLNVEAFPDFWLVYDVLGQAYMADGNNQLAIENFSHSLELNPENTNAAEMLKKLKKP